MIKKSLMIGSLAAVFLLSGCGSSSVSDNIPDRPDIPDIPETKIAYVIVNNLPEEICTNRFIQDEMQEKVDNMEGVEDLTITVEPGTVNCATYGRTNSDADLCHEFVSRVMNTPKSCVITAEMDRDAIDEGKYEDFIDIIMDQYL